MEDFEEGKAIELIYAAMLGEVPWQNFMRYLAASSPNGKAVLVLHDEEKEKGFIPIASGVELSTLKAYSDYYASVNPFMSPAAALPHGVGVPDIELVPQDDLNKTEFYNDFLKPHGMPSRVSMTIGKSGRLMFVLALLSDSMDPDDKYVIAKKMTALSPHLQRASRFYQKGASERLANNMGCTLFDAIDKGLVVVGQDARVKTTSQKADEMLSRGVGVKVSPVGKLRFDDVEIQSVLEQKLDRWYMGPKVVSCYVEGMKLCLVRIECDDISFYLEGPTVVVILEEMRSSIGNIDLKGVSYRKNLTRAEFRALLGIVEGKSIYQISREASRSVETIRSQTKSLYKKLGVGCREEVLRLLLSANF